MSLQYSSRVVSRELFAMGIESLLQAVCLPVVASSSFSQAHEHVLKSLGFVFA